MHDTESRSIARRTVPRTRPDQRTEPEPAVDPDVWLLHVCFRRHRCAATSDALVGIYAEPARRLARRSHRHREPLEDLEQVALEALLRSLDRFDPALGVPFLGYATPFIAGALKRHFRDAGWAVRTPRWVHELSPSYHHTRSELAQQLGRRPDRREVAAALGVPVERVDRLAAATDARNLRSLDGPAVVRNDVDPSGDRAFEQVDNRAALDQALGVLDASDRSLLRRYHVESMTQSEIGAVVGVSQMEISRRLRRIHGRLRHQIAA
jgi:RNA polymerase sigma-B factor